MDAEGRAMQELLPRHEEHEVFTFTDICSSTTAPALLYYRPSMAFMQYQHFLVHVSNAGAIAEVFLRALRVFVV